MSTREHTDLERELLAAAKSFDLVPVSGDAWQQNRRRLAASRSRRGSRLLVAAAAVVAVLLVGGVVAVASGGRDGGTPANGGGDSSGSDDVFAAKNLLGPIVEVEGLTVGGERVVHEAALSDTSGKGPSLCDRVMGATGGSGGCTSREPGADDPGVAFDWLTGTEGSGDIRGVLAGVDQRVVKVQIWMSDGEERVAKLKPGGWEGTQLFALTVPADGPVPQRLVAYGDDGGRNVLQAVDLPALFGKGWLAQRVSACRNEGGTGTWPLPGAGGATDVGIAWGSSDALVTVGNDTPVCLGTLRAAALAGWTYIGPKVVVAVGPEVALVRVVSRGRQVTQILPSTSEGSPLQAVVFRGLDETVRQDAELVALDVTGRVLDQEYLNQPSSP